MIDALICDGVRTPFGRYAGALSGVRTDDLAALPLRALVERHSGVNWQALDDVIYGCANQAGEDNRNVARMALLLAGLPAGGARRHRQPPVRVEPGGCRRCRQSHQKRRRPTGDRRRRREHVARPLRDGEESRAIRAQPATGRHDARVALRQRRDEGPLRHRLDGRNRGKRRRGVRHIARRSGCLRMAEPAAGQRRWARRPAGPGDRPGLRSAAKGRQPALSLATSTRVPM